MQRQPRVIVLYVKGTHPSNLEKTRPDLQLVFPSPADDEGFPAIKSFHKDDAPQFDRGCYMIPSRSSGHARRFLFLMFWFILTLTLLKFSHYSSLISVDKTGQ